MGGRFTGSNESATNDFKTIAEIKAAPADGAWTELALPENTGVFRFLKYESPNGGWGNVAEIEFYNGARKLTGTAGFGTIGSRENSGNDFSKALDGDTATFFDGVSPNSQYTGLDLGPASQVATPALTLAAGAYEQSQTLAITCATPGATIRFTDNGQRPDQNAKRYEAPLKLEKSALITAVAFAPGLGESSAVSAAYRIGPRTKPAKTVTTFHIGNSLTDTVDGYLKPVIDSAGYEHRFHRFTIPGAPTDWLWEHPGTGFGDSRFEEAFLMYAPIDHLFTQPFAGHDRAIENEADYSGRFFAACRKHSPEVQHWLYVQWPDKKFQDAWSQARGAAKSLGLKPAATWEDGVANHLAYVEAVREKLDSAQDGKSVRICPGGVALALLKKRIEAGEAAGMRDFFVECFDDDLHLNAAGRHLVSLGFYACMFAESPEGKVTAAPAGLTPEQAQLFAQLAWEAVRDYRWAK